MCAMVADVEINGKKRKIAATALREGHRMLRHLVTSAGSSQLKTALDEVEDCDGHREIAASEVMEPTYIYRTAAPSIDVNNHLRQGILALEKVVAPKSQGKSRMPSWAKRILTALWGIAGTNAYNPHKKFAAEPHDHLILFIQAAAIAIINKHKKVVVAATKSDSVANAIPTNTDVASHYTQCFKELGLWKQAL
jgi:hypothetical protein